ncbi:hypothetical protein NDU88_000873 [Pleurodeles waltl]|uniref:Uncharacterized protein n=1 Tax=Pleurodeles waltl TaxID=8319 RepID=A0AAV7V9M0_PLEWA|nr:hypothetical protein NDU88_000873 [Pleurodeles waltl]
MKSSAARADGAHSPPSKTKQAIPCAIRSARASSACRGGERTRAAHLPAQQRWEVRGAVRKALVVPLPSVAWQGHQAA